MLTWPSQDPREGVSRWGLRRAGSCWGLRTTPSLSLPSSSQPQAVLTARCPAPQPSASMWPGDCSVSYYHMLYLTLKTTTHLDIHCFPLSIISQKIKLWILWITMICKLQVVKSYLTCTASGATTGSWASPSSSTSSKGGERSWLPMWPGGLGSPSPKHKWTVSRNLKHLPCIL